MDYYSLFLCCRQKLNRFRLNSNMEVQIWHGQAEHRLKNHAKGAALIFEVSSLQLSNTVTKYNSSKSTLAMNKTVPC